MPRDTAPQEKVLPPVGLVAAWGSYPRVVARALRQQGRRVAGLGVEGHCDPDFAELCDEFRMIGIPQLGRAIRLFRGWGVREATMAGKFHKRRMFEVRRFWRGVPDWRTLRAFYRHFLPTRADRKDDTLLTVICDEFARDGIRFLPATDFAPELLVKAGVLTLRRPTLAQRLDIEFGWKLAKEMGRLDVGQSVAVKGRAVLAVEAIEGTDECIRRAGELCRVGGFTLVKVAKPRQDMRFDVPTIGRGTIEALASAGGTVLAIEAGRTILLDEREVIELANRSRVAIVALEDSALAEYDTSTLDPETSHNSRER